ncbi:MAG: A/G-specific adenine glycosylase [Thermoguttaceae bacterium]
MKDAKRRPVRSSFILDPSSLPPPAWRRSFRRRLLAWYAKAARDLPWRRVGGDPYAVWVSEIMLQQTQVAAVGPYFRRFLAALPTVAALAAAEQREVLRLWEGLGYYRRAGQLHQAARLVCSRHGGRIPRTVAELRALPGIGRYTAGAILSIALDQPQPILEANTSRLFCRLLAWPGDMASAAGQKLGWALAEALLPRRGAGRFNQALMELGSAVCQPRVPRCEVCPVAGLCRAQAEGLQLQIPPPKQKPAPQAVREAAVVVRRGGRVLLLRHPDGGRWAGLWDFPRFALEASRGQSQFSSRGLSQFSSDENGTVPLAGDLSRALAAGVRTLTGVGVRPRRHLKTLRHGVTRFRITLECYEAESISPAQGKLAAAALRWVRPGELETYPLSSTARKLARLVQRAEVD